MKIFRLVCLSMLAVLALVTAGCSASSDMNKEPPTAQENSGYNVGGFDTMAINPNMTISFTYVPPKGTYYDLKGKVSSTVNPSLFKIAVYIYVNYWGYVTKPYLTAPYTTIKSDRTWICDITTGGQDHMATQIYAFLINKSYNAPVFLRLPSLPTELFNNCSNYTYVYR